jgi:hypothetical protein
MRYLSRSIIGAFTVFVLVAATAAPAQEAAPHPRALEGRVVNKFSGLGLGKVVVRLFSPQGTLMDITDTDKSGLYRLDLGVLDRGDFAVLDKFYVEATDNQHRTGRAGLADATETRPGVLVLPVLSLP